MILDYFLKAFHDDRSECYGAIVYLFSYLCFLGYRKNGGHLEHVWDSSLGYGEIEYVRKHSIQLVCACSEDAAMILDWAGSLVRVNMLKCLTRTGHGEGEPTVFGSGPRRWHCAILNEGEEGV